MSATSLEDQRWHHVEVLKHGLEATVRQLSHMPEVHKVVLFGSYAAGRRDLFTDLDILVVMDSPLDVVSRCAELARSVRAGVDLDLLAYTPQEQEMERMRDRPFIRQALCTGKVLYERRCSA